MYTLAIHGGAGTLRPQDMSAEQEAAHLQALRAALAAGEALLAEGRSALDAVEAAVRSLEDCPLFNAGRGAVYAHNGQQEMDAAIMCGQTRAAGAVGLLRHIANPVSVARRVMEASPHVLLCGEGALDFARAQGFALMDADYFHDAYRWQQWQAARAAERVQLDHADTKFGTVGAVARDRQGNLAAATSTGGMTNKQFGRIGDSPLIGSGTYADNASCAVSCTGYGEAFIRGVAAYDVACLMAYRGLSLAEAAATVIMEKMPALGGEGGLIAVDAAGHFALPFNSEGMYRGALRAGEAPLLGIYKTAAGMA